nr:nucleoside diphosphate-linked moiety X motif 19-like [Rhipicephalus microplus]
MSAPPWKEAASLIVVSCARLRDIVGKDLATATMATVWNSQAERVSRCDYRVLVVKRSSLSSFIANFYVYPGGLCEPFDFPFDWWEVFAAVGATKNISQGCDFAYLISAIRETFEETGVLLLTQAAPALGEAILVDSISEGIYITLSRQRLREDPVNLSRMCRENRLCRNVRALHECWDWSTPISVGHRRYDTSRGKAADARRFAAASIAGKAHINNVVD